jgi:HIRAN domain-containing protein
MFGLIRRNEFDQFKREVAKECAALRRDIEDLRTGRTDAAAASSSPRSPMPSAIQVGTTFELAGSSSDGFPVAVVGESYRQSTLKAFAGAQRPAGDAIVFTAALVPDPANVHDANAVQVHIHKGSQVGFLSREDAAAYAATTRLLMSAKAIGLCRARVIGGTAGKPSLGVQLDLGEPTVVHLALLEAISPSETL